MAKDIDGVDPNVTNPNNPGKDQAPVDPSNTSSVGQRVEQGVIDTKEGISEQSSKWEDEQERSVRSNENTSRAESYLKHPSREEMNIEQEQQESDELPDKSAGK